MNQGLVGANRELFPQYAGGLYPLEQCGHCFVSRGLGSNTAPDPFNRPDLPHLILRSGE